MDELNHEHLKEVVNACPNLEVFVHSRIGTNVDGQHVYDLGPPVASLFLNANLLYAGGYPRALEQCSNLQELYMTGDNGHHFETTRITDEVIANVFLPARFSKLVNLTITDFRRISRTWP